MWMDAYVEDTLLRERIADAQRRAAMNYLLRGAKPVRARRGVRELVSRLLQRRAQPAARETIDVDRHGRAERSLQMTFVPQVKRRIDRRV